jgi:uncharacterized protein YbjT (DUF2867 family)
MTRVLVLGANGQLARNTTRSFLEHDDVRLTLSLRQAHRLHNPNAQCVTVMEADVLDPLALHKAMRGQDVVYANLAGDDGATGSRHRRRDASGGVEAPDLHQLDGHLR